MTELRQTLTATASEVTVDDIERKLDDLLLREQVEEAATLYKRARDMSLDLTFPQRLIHALKRLGFDAEAHRLALEAPFPHDPAPWQVIHRAATLESIGASESAFELLDAALAQFPKAAALRTALAKQAFLAGKPLPKIVELVRIATESASPEAPVLNRIVELLETGWTTVLGFTLRLPVDVVSPQVALAVMRGYYEHDERRAATGDLRPEDRVLELGCGIGLVSLEIARAQPLTQILCVEANPALENATRESFAANGCSADLVGAVATLADGETDFYLARDFWESAAAPISSPVSVIRRKSVDVNRLIKEFDPSIIVMDIEGGELDLIPKMVLDGLRRLVIEFHPANCQADAISASIAHLLNSGFMLDLGAGSQQVLVFDRHSPPDSESA